VGLHTGDKIVHSESLTQVLVFRNLLSPERFFLCLPSKASALAPMLGRIRVEVQVVRVANLRPTMLRNRLGGGLKRRSWKDQRWVSYGAIG
jgi:hypothetical protein